MSASHRFHATRLQGDERLRYLVFCAEACTNAQVRSWRLLGASATWKSSRIAFET